MKGRSPITSRARIPAQNVPLRGVGDKLHFPRDSSIIDRFEKIVDHHSERPAISYRDSCLTFAEVNNLANRTATALLRSGVTSGDLTPLLIADGPEFVIGLLAAAKIGAPFVPVDPGWPAERLDMIFDQLSPKVILAVPATAPLLEPLGLAGRAVLLNARPQPISPPPHAPRPGPEDFIYGYFTSGSTGAPKCALNLHRGLVNRLASMSRHFGDGATQVVLQNSRPTFDSSMWQILWPLTSGGRLVLPDRRGILDLEETCDIIGRHGVTITDFVPSVLSALVTLLELRPDLRERLAGLNRMLIGGEAANAAVLRRLRNLLPQLQLTNTYGPTECSIGSVFHDIADGEDPVPLGRPIPNTAAIILDENRHPAPAGTVGEIFIGGECVGAGYLNDKERTEQAFIANPFGEIPGPRLYRTGDLGHFRSDGLLMFDGRRDAQVKVGGVRVELAEIERALNKNPTIRDATVVIRGEGDSRALVAFVTSGPTPADPTEVRNQLHRELPAETIPQQIIVLSTMPLMHNGKIDRRALQQAAEEATAKNAERDFLPPATPEEELVHSVWQTVLGRTHISVTATFAESGGTSLLAHRLSSLLQSRAGRAVPLPDLLSADTVRAQAALLTGNTASTAPANTAALANDARLASLPDVRASQAPARSRQLLMTGATGFVGAHLLAELLNRPAVETTCLVRASDVTAGRERLAAALRHYRLIDAERQLTYRMATGALRVLPGDLAEPALGLTAHKFDRLAREIDGIVHAGALVNFIYDYARHRAPNVLGTRELMRLALSGDGCRLHVLSTFSAFAPAQLDGAPVTEEQLPQADLLPDDGYGQSKHVMERLLENGRLHRLESVVYRLGEVWPHSRTGVPNPASLAHSVIYACARTGSVFPTAAVTDHVPVDLVARYLAATACGPRPDSDQVHVLRPAPLPIADIFDRLVKVSPVQPTGYPEFHRRLTALVEQKDADERLLRVAMLLPDPVGAQRRAPAAFDRLFMDTARHFEVGSVLDHAPTSAAMLVGSPLDDLSAFIDRMASEVPHH